MQFSGQNTLVTTEVYQGGTMQTTLLIFIILFSLVNATLAAGPYLVCDPYTPETGIPTHFSGTLDGQPFQTPYTLHPEGPAIVYDIGPLSPQKHTFQEIRACNERGCSEPIPFPIPPVPIAIAHPRLIK